MKIQNLDHIGVFSSDLDRSVRFYCENLGFSLKSRQQGTRADGSTFWMAFIANGSCEIELVEPPKGYEAKDGTVCHIALSADDADAAFRFLKARGVNVEWDAPRTEDFFRLGLKHFFFRGPDNERLEICQKL